MVKLDAASQAGHFGYNCDFVAFMPLPKGSNSSDHGLLCVNNEYVSAHIMFEGLKEDGMGAAMTKEQVALCNLAIGHSIVEIKHDGGAWKTNPESAMNRRITLETEFVISDPAPGMS